MCIILFTNFSNNSFFGETNCHNIHNLFIMIFYYGQNYDNYGNSFQKTTGKQIFIRIILCKTSAKRLSTYGAQESGKAERVDKIRINQDNSFPKRKSIRFRSKILRFQKKRGIRFRRPSRARIQYRNEKLSHTSRTLFSVCLIPMADSQVREV